MNKTEANGLGTMVKKIVAKSPGLKRGVAFTMFAILIVIAGLWSAPCLGIQEGGKISLSRLQLGYGLISLVIAAAVYVWGVGNWSRFEPPRSSHDNPMTSANSQANPSGSMPSVPAKAAPQTPPPGAPAVPKGGN